MAQLMEGSENKKPRSRAGVFVWNGAAGRIIRAYGPHPLGAAVALLRRSSTHSVSFGRTSFGSNPPSYT